MALLHPIPAESSFSIYFAGQVPENGSSCLHTSHLTECALENKNVYTALQAFIRLCSS
jgi:hypothetical protein